MSAKALSYSKPLVRVHLIASGLSLGKSTRP